MRPRVGRVETVRRAVNVWTDLLPPGWPEQVLRITSEVADLRAVADTVDLSPLREVTAADTARDDLGLDETRWFVNDSRYDDFAAARNCHTIFAVEATVHALEVTNSYGDVGADHGGVLSLLRAVAEADPAARYLARAWDPGSGSGSDMVTGVVAELRL